MSAGLYKLTVESQAVADSQIRRQIFVRQKSDEIIRIFVFFCFFFENHIHDKLKFIFQLKPGVETTK